MVIGKDVIKLSKEIVERGDWEFLGREYTDRGLRAEKREIMEELVANDINPQKDMVRLYEAGVSCKELGELLGRSLQSVSRSVKTFGGEGVVERHRSSRKEWVRLIARYEVVYLTDIAGSYKGLMVRLGVDLSKAKDVYRRAGGTVMVQRAKIKEQKTDEIIRVMLGEGYTVAEISKVMGMPETTVYYRVNNHIRGRE